MKNEAKKCSNCGNWDLEKTRLPWLYRKLSRFFNFRAKKCRKCYNVEIYIKNKKMNNLCCENCGWTGEEDELRTAMVDNKNNHQDHSLWEIKICPECGGDVIQE